MRTLAEVYVTTSHQIQRRQLQWIMLGLFCALVLAVVDLVLTLSAEQCSQIHAWLLLGFLPLPIIDRLFFRQQVDHQTALGRWSEEPGTSLRFAELARLLLQEVLERLGVEQVWLLVLDEGECCLEPVSLSDAAAGAMEDLSIRQGSRTCPRRGSLWPKTNLTSYG